MTTVIEVMKQTVNESGDIVIPVGAIKGNDELPGTVSETWLRTAFGEQLNQTVPLSESKYETLKNTIPGQWEANWQWYRDNAMI